MSALKGVIVENGLLDLKVLDFVSVLSTRRKEIGISDIWIVHDVELQEKNLSKVTKLLIKALRPGWYSYFVKDGRRVIIFKGKVFDIKRGSEKSLAEVKNWAFKKYNILPDVLSLEI